jgi:hypothetical protein
MSRWWFRGQPIEVDRSELVARLGRAPEPVRALPRSRRVAQTFWGQAWCDHLEGLRDLANRLTRGRTYLRNGAVRDLWIERGVIEALVQGTSLYEVVIRITPLEEPRAAALRAAVSEELSSVVALLEGRMSEPLVRLLRDPQRGLFPRRTDIAFDCDCPDGARVCKHLAAVFYGVGVRLDQHPELFFTLRGMDPSRLVADATFARAAPPRSRRLDGDLGAIFGVHVVDALPGGGRWVPGAEARRRELLEVVSSSTIQTWRRAGLLEDAGRRGVYRLTPEACRRLEESA